MMITDRRRAYPYLRNNMQHAHMKAKTRDIADLSPDLEQIAVLRGEGKRIDSCMEESESDPARRQACLCGGIDCQEPADQVSVPLKTMRTWLRRSLLKLKECMDR